MKTNPKILLIFLVLLSVSTSSLFGNCYLRVEKSGTYDPAIINENAIAHVSSFVEKVNNLPPEGLKMDDDCVYNVNVVEDNTGIIVTINGRQLNSSGDSRLRGLDGFQQAVLRSIVKSDSRQLSKICNRYPNLMKEECASQVGADYSITSQRLSSDPAAAKKYKMALIFKKRGKPDKAAMFYHEIIKKYPGSLEAAYVQMHYMSEDLKSRRKAKEFSNPLLNSIMSINAAYQSTSMSKTLKVDAIKWLIELVAENKRLGKHNGVLFSAILPITQQKPSTNLINQLKALSTEWQISLGEVELSKPDGDASAQVYFANAEKLGISDRKAKFLTEKLRAAQIRALMRNGMRDEAEMAIVEWEVEDENSSVLNKLKKEFDRPANMATVQAGKVRHAWVESFNLDKYEVTNAQFLNFVKENPRFQKSRITPQLNDKDYLQRWRGDDRFPEELSEIPVVFVSQIIAGEFCKWAGKRLPTDLEWSLAAGEGVRNYPWGNNPPDKTLANYKKGVFGNPMSGDSHPAGATPDGIMHMAGNVWEWTSTIKGRKGIARGGSYYDSEEILHNENKHMTGDIPTYSSRFMGFRCAK